MKMKNAWRNTFENKALIFASIMLASAALLNLAVHNVSPGVATEEELDPNRIKPAAGAEYKNFSSNFVIKTLYDHTEFPLVIAPVQGVNTLLSPLCVDGVESSTRFDAASFESLLCFVKKHRDWLKSLHLKHGALLFRGFKVENAKNFEVLAEELLFPLEPFRGVYLGTSPRLNNYNKTSGVYTASEIPSNEVIPVHLEMSFRHKPPSKILFWSELPNSSPGGETPLCDFRQLWRDMKPEMRNRFREGGVRYIRHYFSDQRGGRDSYAPWTRHKSFTKSWEAMFSTNSTEEAEKMAKAQGFEVEWLFGDALLMKLSHVMNATRIHPETMEEHWNNHISVLHGNSWSIEYAAAIDRTSSIFHKFNMFYQYIKETLVKHAIMLAMKGRLEGIGTHVTYANGLEIPEAEMLHFRRLMARNMVTERWEKDDAMFLDNNRIAHGRHSFKGPRSILTVWSE